MGRKSASMMACAVVVSAVIGLLLPIAAGAQPPAAPFETNSECLSCHDLATGSGAFTKVDFTVSPVDKATACPKCHWPQNHYPHGSTVQCNNCHYSYPTRSDFFYSAANTAYGFFNTPSSPNADPQLLHQIHVNGSWPQQVTTHPQTGQRVYCASCHAPAACGACHGDVGHGEHTLSPTDPYPPVTRRVTSGATTTEYSTADTTYEESSRCVNDACHSTSEAAVGLVRQDYQETAPSIVYTPAWTALLSPDFSGGQAYRTFRVGYQAVATLQGPGVIRVFSYKGPNVGMMSVSVDGAPAILFDGYAASSMYNAIVLETAMLGTGPHTVTITALGQRNPLSTSNYVYLDRIELLSPTDIDFVPFCGTCHTRNVDTHGYEQADHEADVAAQSDPGAPPCGSCHSMDVLTEHERATSASAGGSCGTCHPQPRNTFDAWNDTCEQGDCHATGSATERHAGMTSAHTPPTAGEICGDCHPGDLGAVHSAATTTTPEGERASCNVCHTTGVYPPTNDCTVCHFTFDNHYDPVLHTSVWTLDTCGGSGCHSTRDLMDVHAEKNAAFDCFGCHASADPSVQAAIQSGDTACGACHTGVSPTEGHRDVHWAIPPLVGGDVTPTPYYSYFTGSAGTAPTTDCAGCHVSNLVDEHMGVYENGQWTRLPRQDSAGVALSCPSCHASLDPAVADAIAVGETKCDACHSVHGPIGVVHQSAYTAEDASQCSLCHSPDVTIVHNGYMTATTPSGAVLSGCEICHGYFEGERGVTVQNAIGVTNDTKCTACHAAYHGDAATSHTAASAESTGACGPCHDDDAMASGIDVTAVHAAASAGACAVCHVNPARVPDITTETAECASCHTAEGTDYHRNMPVHVSPQAAQCSGQCHHQNPDVTVVHAAGCTTCHGVVNTDGITTACSNCHVVEGADYHPNIATAHNPGDAGSLDCARCHGSTDLRVVHVTNECATCHTGACGDCHVAHSPTPGTALLRSTACAGCHEVVGTDYHLQADAKHTFGAMDPSCVSAGCHAANALPEAHEPYLSRYPAYIDTCALCHLNQDPDRIDWSTATADCSTCHTVHGDIATIHTPSASDACTRCHDEGNALSIHEGAPEGACTVCHANPDRVPDIGAETIECASCHAIVGTEYHRDADASHTFGAMDPSCVGAGCHAANTLPEAHEPYVSRYPGYSDTCALCHLNEDPGRIDWSTATADCSTCHTVHGDVAVIHQAPGSQECVDCHETPDVRDIHPECGTCHNGTVDTSGTTACGNAGCHAGYVPPDPNHYQATPHTATAHTGCNNCHYMEMKPEHAKATAGPVSCVQCHETKVDGFTSAWDRTCDACHPDRHGQQQAKHVSTSAGCSGTGCHNTEDVSDVHKGLPGGGCSACHTSRDSLPTTTDCAVCHPGVGTNHHEQHDAQEANPTGCRGCHFMYLDDEHAALGLTCDTCHDSTDPVVEGAISSADRECLNCHQDSPHNDRQEFEFAPGNASVHRVDDDLPGMRSSFVINGTTYTWSLPSSSSFLKTGYTTSSMLACDSCHTYSGATGPHGATMQVNFDPGYTEDWKTAWLKNTSNGMTTNGSSAATNIICAKCHDLYGSSWSNKVHEKGDHQKSDKGKCIYCHVQVPHGWGRPRLIGSTTDPAPYRVATGGITKIALKNYTPSGWNDSDCFAACAGDHDKDISNAWPNIMGSNPSPTTGTVSGIVTDSSTSAVISGATVALSGVSSTTSASDGTYSFTNVNPGTYTLTVSKSGYADWSGSVSVLAGQVTTQNVALTASSAGSNLALNKSFTASRYESSQYAPSKAGDGDAATFWWSDDHGDDESREWIGVDLGSTYRVGKVEIAWQGTYWAKEYRLYTSMDAKEWKEVYSTSRAQSGTNSVTFSARDARYVKLECRKTGSGQSNGYGVAELRVFAP